MNYPFMSRSEVRKYYKLIEELNMSLIARSPHGFLYNYLKNTLTPELINKRNAFIARTLAAYNRNPTVRRYLSLITWSYKPEIKPKRE